eukprot:767652-Hanusia_phi.AAC.1
MLNPPSHSARPVKESSPQASLTESLGIDPSLPSPSHKFQVCCGPAAQRRQCSADSQSIRSAASERSIGAGGRIVRRCGLKTSQGEQCWGELIGMVG